MPIEIIKNEINNKKSTLFGNRTFLSYMLWCKYVEAVDKISPFSVVTTNDYKEFGYELGHVYMGLKYNSDIHPTCYVDLTWGEFYRWYGLFDWELGESERESVCFKESEGVRSIEEIMIQL